MEFPDVSGMPLAELLSLRGRVAVVTGAGRGIGEAVARRLGEAGASLVLADVDADTAADLARRLTEELGVDACARRVDVGSPEDVDGLAEFSVRERGGLDVWVNNAGVYPNVPFLEMSPEEWDRVQQVNSRGTFLGARAAATQMVRVGRGGTIVNLASIAGLNSGGAGYGAYTASKHAVVGLTKSLATELGPHGIRAVGVAPGVIETAGLRETMVADGGAAFRAFSATLPSGRGGVPDDIARVVWFLASDLAAFITGTTVLVDGGCTVA